MTLTRHVLVNSVHLWRCDWLKYFENQLKLGFRISIELSSENRKKYLYIVFDVSSYSSGCSVSSLTGLRAVLLPG